MTAPTAPVLDGRTVLDLTQQLPGPYATSLLVALGARVIKVEPPAGDLGRSLDPAMFANVNGGKESVVLDLKTGAGRRALHGLAALSDVLVEGFRPGVAGRLGAGYDEIAGVAPSIVYCSLSGFGASGPYVAVPGHDLNYLGVAGGVPAPAEGVVGESDHIGMPTVDLASGTMASLSIVAALLGRERSGKGMFLDVAMLDSAVHWSAVKPLQADDGMSEPAYGVVRCADGLALSFAVLEDKFWQNLCSALGWSDWAEAPELATHESRRGRAVEIRGRLERTIASRPRDAWLAVLWEADVPAAPVHAPDRVPADPQVRDRGLFVGGAAGERPLLGSPLPPALRRSTAPVPALGAHTATVLAELGHAR